jgi:hypothetical protein
MNTELPRTTYVRAVHEYDEEHERVLVEAILRAIFDASHVSDLDCIVLRTGELTSALLSALAATIAMSPSATRSPTSIRKTIDDLSKRLRRRIASAEENEVLQELMRRKFFRGNNVGGHA